MKRFNLNSVLALVLAVIGIVLIVLVLCVEVANPALVLAFGEILVGVAAATVLASV